MCHRPAQGRRSWWRDWPGRSGMCTRCAASTCLSRTDGAGPARAEPCGQDDRGAHLDDVAAAGRGAGGGGRPRRRSGGGRGAPLDRPGRPVGGLSGGADRPGEPRADREALPPEEGAGPQPRRRAAGPVRPRRRRVPPGQGLLRWHAAAPGPGRKPGRPAQAAVPDEPTNGLDPRSRLGMWAIILSLVAGGTTLLPTT
jgi:hypothetical protein